MVQAVSAAGLAKLVASSDSLPGLTVGRQLVATVLGQPRNGLVLVSMFGRQLNVETALDLKPGQILNLRVEALSPQIIMRPAPQTAAGQSEGPPVNQRLVELVERFSGQLEKGEVRDFEIRNVVNRLLEQNDSEAARALKPLIDQIVQYPQAVALFLIPVNDESSSGRGVVAVEREEDEYVLRFRLDTDHIGRVSALARLGESLKVEICVAHPEVAELMRAHLGELAERLEPLGLSELSVRLVEPNLNMLV